ncbi:DUF1501 domain-containing protein, partial [Acinetobacter baumannii]
IGSLGLGGLSLSHLLSAQAVPLPEMTPLTRGKSIIYLLLHGGPSQFETFDPKTMIAPAEIRSVTGEVQTALPGITFGSSFPRLAA